MKEYNNISVDGKTMAEIDKYAIEVLEIPSILLVERASLAVMKNINLALRKSFAIVMSIGNNGADAMALARNLLALGKDVDCYILGDIKKAGKEFLINYRAVENLKANIYFVETIEDLEKMDKNLDRVNTIIDGIFGTGLSRTVKGIYSYVINLINRKRIYTISIDLPSGLDPSGEMDFGEYIDSDLIVSMELMKKALDENSYLREKTVVEEIGIPKLAIEKVLGINWKIKKIMVYYK